MRRALWETLVDVVNAMSVAPAADAGIRVASFLMDLPMEITPPTERTGEVLADVPGWRWVTDFDLPVSRLKIVGLVETRLAPSGPNAGTVLDMEGVLEESAVCQLEEAREENRCERPR